MYIISLYWSIQTLSRVGQGDLQDSSGTNISDITLSIILMIISYFYRALFIAHAHCLQQEEKSKNPHLDRCIKYLMLRNFDKSLLDTINKEYVQMEFWDQGLSQKEDELLKDLPQQLHQLVLA